MAPLASSSTPTPTRVQPKRANSSPVPSPSPTKKVRSSPLKPVKDEPDSPEVRDRKPKLEGDDSADVKPKSPRKPKAFVNSLATPHPAPSRWREVYDIIAKQRKGIVAPVDTMGCEQGGRGPEEKPPSEREKRLSTLVSLMLSPQTKDPVTHQATMNLRGLPKGLSLESLLEETPEAINACINKVGFHNVKTGSLKKLGIRLRDMHDGDVPGDLPSLLAIDGCGPKIAILYLNSIGVEAGIGVDVHVHRISNRLGWHKPITTQPEQTRLNLESWLPQELHRPINKVLVGFGQAICLPRGPRCDLCHVARVPGLCPSKQAVSPRKPAKGSKTESPDKNHFLDGKPALKINLEALAMQSPIKQEGEGSVKQEEKDLAW